jgi:DNA/RNA-binding domain of Phe-tRNA-synthetase-like protein
MRFCVDPLVFEHFPDACFGVVVVHGIRKPVDGVEAMLAEVCAGAADLFPEGVRQHQAIKVWREAFTALGYNPNKFLSSIEALSSRVYKNGSLPAINWLVDLVNMLSVTHLTPMGAHDLGRMSGDIELRPARSGDMFTPFGSVESEAVPAGELVYADAAEVRTRRWVWRQGDKAKIHADSKDIFFPVDGFSPVTGGQVLAARDQLAKLISPVSERTEVFMANREQPIIEWRT